MSAVLNPAPPIRPGESPESYVSRLCGIHDGTDVRTFCKVIGLTYRGVLNGRAETLSTLAGLVGSPLARIGADAIVRDRDSDRYEFRGQSLVGHSLRRDRLLACPACLRADLDAGAPPFGRASWSVGYVRTCERHRLALVEMGRSTSGRPGIDFGRVIRPDPATLERLASQATARPVSSLERYLTGRLRGASERCDWLDALPFHVAARTCELIGTVAVFGPRQNLDTMDDDDRYRAGEAGFEIASGGTVRFAEFLHGLRQSHRGGRLSTSGPQAWFGRLYQSLGAVEDDGFDPVREALRAYVVGNTPVGPGDEIFGRPVEKRRLHSLRTAHLETGIHPITLRKVLNASGHIRTVGRKPSDHDVTFDAAEVAPLLDRLRTALTALELREHMNAPRVHAKLLVDAGFVPPVLAEANAGNQVFARDDVNAFLSRLLERADPAAAEGDEMVDIPAAAKRACCQAMAIVDLILRGALRRIGRRPGQTGYMAVLVHLPEIRARFRGPELDGLTVEVFQKALGCRFEAVAAMIEDGVVKVTTQRHPVNRNPLRIVPHAEVARFRSTYASLFEAARALGAHHLKLKAFLAARGIEPALDPRRFRVSFYLRSHLADLRPESHPELFLLSRPRPRSRR